MGFGIGRALGAISKGVLTGKRDAQDRRMADEWRAYQLQQQLGERAQAQANWEAEQAQQNARDAATNGRWNLTRLDAQAAERRTMLGNAAKMAMGQESEFATPDELEAFGLERNLRVLRASLPSLVNLRKAQAKEKDDASVDKMMADLSASLVQPVTSTVTRPGVQETMPQRGLLLPQRPSLDAMVAQRQGMQGPNVQSAPVTTPVPSLVRQGAPTTETLSRPKTFEEQRAEVLGSGLPALDKQRMMPVLAGLVPMQTDDGRTIYVKPDTAAREGITTPTEQAGIDLKASQIKVNEQRAKLLGIDILFAPAEAKARLAHLKVSDTATMMRARKAAQPGGATNAQNRAWLNSAQSNYEAYLGALQERGEAIADRWVPDKYKPGTFVYTGKDEAADKKALEQIEAQLLVGEQKLADFANKAAAGAGMPALVPTPTSTTVVVNPFGGGGKTDPPAKGGTAKPTKHAPFPPAIQSFLNPLYKGKLKGKGAEVVTFVDDALAYGKSKGLAGDALHRGVINALKKKYQL